MTQAKTHDAAGGGEAEHDGVRGENDGGEVFWPFIHRFEVDLLAAGAGEHGAELEPDEEAAEGEDEAEDPEHEGSTNRPDRT